MSEQSAEIAQVPDQEKRAVRNALSDHFVMWTPSTVEGGPAGDWICQCGLEFGFSDTAIDHVAEEVERVIERREARARYFVFWRFFLRLPGPTPLSDAVQREAMRLRELVPGVTP